MANAGKQLGLKLRTLINNAKETNVAEVRACCSEAEQLTPAGRAACLLVMYSAEVLKSVGRKLGGSSADVTGTLLVLTLMMQPDSEDGDVFEPEFAGCDAYVGKRTKWLIKATALFANLEAILRNNNPSPCGRDDMSMSSSSSSSSSSNNENAPVDTVEDATDASKEVPSAVVSSKNVSSGQKSGKSNKKGNNNKANNKNNNSNNKNNNNKNNNNNNSSNKPTNTPLPSSSSSSSSSSLSSPSSSSSSADERTERIVLTVRLLRWACEEGSRKDVKPIAQCRPLLSAMLAAIACRSAQPEFAALAADAAAGMHALCMAAFVREVNEVAGLAVAMRWVTEATRPVQQQQQRQQQQLGVVMMVKEGSEVAQGDEGQGVHSPVSTCSAQSSDDEVCNVDALATTATTTTTTTTSSESTSSTTTTTTAPASSVTTALPSTTIEAADEEMSTTASSASSSTTTTTAAACTSESATTSTTTTTSAAAAAAATSSLPFTPPTAMSLTDQCVLVPACTAFMLAFITDLDFKPLMASASSIDALLGTDEALRTAMLLHLSAFREDRAVPAEHRGLARYFTRVAAHLLFASSSSSSTSAAKIDDSAIGSLEAEDFVDDDDDDDGVEDARHKPAAVAATAGAVAVGGRA